MPDDAEREVPEGAAVFPLIPAELGVHPLLLAVLHAVVFLDGSAEAIVDPDAADEALQHLATYVQRLSDADLRRVREDLLALGSHAKQQGWPKQEIRFLKDFLANFGTAGEEKEA
ncbi:MAG: hypothetical protein K2R98_03915 [Gemmataceae bacterium]|nr:hypothetical protein [Gemmataceae bacterium]